MPEFYSRQSFGEFALALFIVGSLYVAAPLVHDTLAEVPWEHLPETTTHTAVAFYDATFMSAAVGYVDFVDALADLQADSYATLFSGVAATPAVLAGSPPVAAVAEWYVSASNRIEGRLAP